MSEGQAPVVYVVQERSTTTDNAVTMILVLLALFLWTLPVGGVGAIFSLMVAMQGGFAIFLGILGGLAAVAVATLPLWVISQL